MEDQMGLTELGVMLTPAVKATGRKPVRRSGKSMPGTVYRGLGWAIDKTANGDRVHHSGSNGTGFRCYCEFDRQRGSGIVIMTNAIGGRELWQQVIAAVAPPCGHPHAGKNDACLLFGEMGNL